MNILSGVGFARMESRDKCDQIIQMFNGSHLQGAKGPLLVKFADGGTKVCAPLSSLLSKYSHTFIPYRRSSPSIVPILVDGMRSPVRWLMSPRYSKMEWA